MKQQEGGGGCVGFVAIALFWIAFGALITFPILAAFDVWDRLETVERQAGVKHAETIWGRLLERREGRLKDEAAGNEDKE